MSSGTVCTILGWVLWDIWCGQEESAKKKALEQTEAEDEGKNYTDVDKEANGNTVGLGLALLNGSTISLGAGSHSRAASAVSFKSATGPESVSQSVPPSPQSQSGQFAPPHKQYSPLSNFSPRNQQRLATAKSAVLILGALLGLSPILKSLTKSTASDSIWAMSFWLMCINVFFFDYSTGDVEPTATFPASLSTNAALMASTVLASRLPNTIHVFSLTLFSIQVFGLFPVFRRYLRHHSSRGNRSLTWALVMGAGSGVATNISSGGWTPAIVGAVLSCLITGFTMGLASWWLIGLQRYKNEIHGPWDPARPIIRRRWD